VIIAAGQALCSTRVSWHATGGLAPPACRFWKSFKTNRRSRCGCGLSCAAVTGTQHGRQEQRSMWMPWCEGGV
jgi:hypothetical protein